MTAAELNWVRGTIDDLRTGRLTWGDELASAARSSLAEAGVTREELGGAHGGTGSD